MAFAGFASWFKDRKDALGIDLNSVVSQAAVFLDRDGVINQAIVREGKPYPPRSVDDLKLGAGVRAGLQQLKQAGFLLLVVTNQPDISRGSMTEANVEAIHFELLKELPIDSFLVCPHDDMDGCACRKPLPGLLLEGARRYGVDLNASFMVGDRWRDVEAGFAAGCRTIWINYGYREKGPDQAPNRIVFSFAEAVDWILKQGDQTTERNQQPES